MDYNLSTTWTVALVILALWELAWKGFALWHASRNNHRNWFIALLLINSVGILPMLYLLLNYGTPHEAEQEQYHDETVIPLQG